MKIQNKFIFAKSLLLALITLSLAACGTKKAAQSKETITEKVVMEDAYKPNGKATPVGDMDVLENKSDNLFDAANASLIKGDWESVTKDLKSGIEAFKKEAKHQKPDRQAVVKAQIIKMEALIPKAEAKKLTLPEFNETTILGEMMILHRALQFTIEESPSYTVITNDQFKDKLKDYEQELSILPKKSQKEGQIILNQTREKLNLFEKDSLVDAKKAEQGVKDALSNFESFIQKNI
jgi:hypothetical protein